ncbi:MAG: DNA polymerase III subunit beta [Patescibacteria group bacterium]
MKFKCTQENLNGALGVVAHIASKNVNLPILNNILVRAKDTSLTLAATNLEIGVVCNVRSKIEEDGSFTVPAQVFASYINLLTGDNIDVDLEGKELVVQSGKQKTKLKGEGVDEFPIIPEVNKENKITCTFEDLVKGLSQVVGSASLDETRPEIAGVYMNFFENELIMAATDSYRLAEKKIKCEYSGENKKAIIPQKTILEFIRISGLFTFEKVDLYISDNQVFFDLGDIKITSRLIEGEYPDYRQIIPQNKNTEVIVDKEKCIKLIKAASLFSKSGINDVNMVFDQKEQLLLVNTVNSQLGENNASMEAEITGGENDIVFNYKYLLDGFTNINSENIKINIIDNASPGVFMPENEDGFVYIIMPIKQ